MGYEVFTEKLVHVKAKLWTTADVVQHSFLVQNSISPLNLELCQSHDIRTTLIQPGYYPSFTYHKGFVDTEEKCRKIHSSSRNLFYSLNLDLPKARESSLKASSQFDKLSYDNQIPHLAKVYIGDEFYTDILCRLIDYTCKYTDHNLKVLKWFIKFGVLKKPLFKELPSYVVYHFLDSMRPGFVDLQFVEECLKKLQFQIWMEMSEKPGRAANLLYHARLGGESFERRIRNAGFIHHCLLHPSFLYVTDVLKFLDAPSFCDRFHVLLKKRILQIRSPLPVTSTPLHSRAKRRRTLLLHLYWTYINRHGGRRKAASESLRLIWNSLKDPFITLGEISTEFGKRLSDRRINSIYNFYSAAIGNLRTSVDLRSLQHYCRSTIRKRLFENKHWLPEGIQKTRFKITVKRDGVEEDALEKEYKLYLNLEKVATWQS